MVYLKHWHNLILVFDTSHPNIDESIFENVMWTDFYEDAVEAIPPNAPPLKGGMVDLCMFVDSDYDGNKWTRRSRPRFMIYMTSIH